MQPCYVDSFITGGRFTDRMGAVASTNDAPLTGIFGDVQRQCSRSGCAEEAVVTLTYQYARSAVWLDDLSAERDPHSYDLCRRHGARLSVPHGWRLEDRRSVIEFAFAAAG
jgi:Protein of unknown function (DUF3499)